MTQTPPFDELPPLIEDRSAALRDAVAACADLDARVPGCPDWSLRDLVAHLGQVQRSWAGVVAAGPAGAPPAEEAMGDLTPQGDLLAWSAESTGLLIASLRAAGPDRGCWAWWGASGTPLTAGSVARHQVHEAAVHAYDAQETATRPEPVPAAVAVDGVAEFLTVACASSGPWPHRPARMGLQSAEGPSWLTDLTPSGAVPAHGREPGPAVVMSGPASDLLLALYGRLPLDRLRIEGERAVAENLLAWLPQD